ncbi:MAG TPA: M23 family metallopeptidase [Candidatus Nanopelagicales bacterium]
MPYGSTPDMLVVVDGHPSSRAPLAIAQRYASGTAILAGWDAPTSLDQGVEVVASATSEPSIAEALALAAQRRIGFVGIRRDLAEPHALLGQLLLATARHTDDDVPGFAIFLAQDDPAPFRRILAVVDHSRGAVSGLAAYAAVAVAATASAELDVIVIGSEDLSVQEDDELALLAINRERDLFERAVARARDDGVPVQFLPASGVADPWALVHDQLAQHDYDLVIDDLGDLSLGPRLRRQEAIDTLLAPGQVGEIPLRLLRETDLPLLLVIDEIRLGIAAATLLKAGTIAALTLGVVGAASLPTASSAVASHSIQAASPEELTRQLQEALGVDDEDLTGPDPGADSGAAAARADQADEASRSDGAAAGRAAAQAEAAPALPTAAAPTPPAADPSVKQAALAAAGQAPSPAAESAPGAEAALAAEAGAPPAAEETAVAAPKPPKGGAQPADVAKATAEARKDRAAYVKDKEQAAEAAEVLEAAQGELAAAQASAEVAVAELAAATEANEAAAGTVASMQADASGLTGILPGGATPEQAEAAAAEAGRTELRLEAAVVRGEEALEQLTTAEEGVARADAELAEREADKAESKAQYAAAKEKVAVYKESLAASRQAPVAKGNYRLTARYGQAGGYWSSGYHTGLDFAGSTGTPIMAAASGKVVSAGWAGPYGNQVVIDHGNGYETTYNHLSRISIAPGATVQTGDRIGAMGGTGNSTGTHLHFEVLRNGKFMDPEAWLGW